MTILLIAGLLTWGLKLLLSTNAAGTCLLFLFSLFVVSATAVTD